MPADEFQLVTRYFIGVGAAQGEGVRLGIGDDGAIVTPAAGTEVVVSVDTLVAGRHFPHATEAADVGWKALAVNLSDLAAMGARPRWCTLALTMPGSDEAWLGRFASGFSAAAEAFGITLIGGDITRGPLALSVTVLGEVPAGQGMSRSGACAGDRIMVTGTLGDASLALRRLQAAEFNDHAARQLRARLDRPTPRIVEGIAARAIASAAIDVSDGLLADLGHILTASCVGATLQVDQIPRSAAFLHWAGEGHSVRELPLTGGDDYELCLCIAPDVQLPAALCRSGLSEIGRIQARPGLRLVSGDGPVALPAHTGFEHFRE